jgi:hypothetical protein
MLTDIFAYRYADVTLRDAFEERDRVLMVQLFRLLEEQVCPYWKDGREDGVGSKFWNSLHSRISMELGVTALSSEWVTKTYGTGAFAHKKTIRLSSVFVCKNWMLMPLSEGYRPDRFIKERLSLVELGFRQRAASLSTQRLALRSISPSSPSQTKVPKMEKEFSANVEELNERLHRAGYPLHYHNGFLQCSDDVLIQRSVEEPFWALVAAPKWVNVDIDMKEALDRRDAGGRDPALYAARALESAVKIISSEKGWTQGKEKGAHNFIDNLVSKGNGRFIEVWEADTLKGFFTSVRNPLGHGPGGEAMPSLTPPQTEWAIAFCMAWIRSLIVRM